MRYSMTQDYTMSLLSKFSLLARRFKRDEDGAAAAEFAMFATIMGVVILLGGWEASTATLVRKRVDNSALVVTDLVTQHTAIDQNTYDTYKSWVTQNVYPYGDPATKAPLKLHVIGVRVESNKKVKLEWQYPKKGTNLVSTKDLPKDLIIPDTFYVITGVELDYELQFGSQLFGAMTFFDKSVMAPRNSRSIQG